MEKFFYRVIAGDTLINISLKFSIPFGIIIHLNNLTCEVEEGDVLYLEKDDFKMYKILPSDTFESVSEKFSVSADELKYKNKTPYLLYGGIIYI